MKKLHNILNLSLKNAGMEKISDLMVLQKRWSQIVGPTIALNSSPAQWRGKILVVTVRTPTWATELSLMKPKLMQKIKESPGAPEPHDIRFVLAKN